MPKLNRPPKYCKDGKYAAVYLHGKKFRLGPHGSPESRIAYARFLAEDRASPAFYAHRGKADTTVREIAAAFLEYAKKTLANGNSVMDTIGRQDLSNDFLRFGINHQMQFTPGATLAFAMCP